MQSSDDREYTREVARFAAGLRYADLHPALVTKAIYSIQDCLALDLYVGAQTDCGRAIAQYAIDESGGNDQATVIGYGKRATAELAALANGTLGLGFEFEDVHIGNQAHPYATVVPAALAIAERLGSSGRDLIAAVVVGHEVACRTGVAARVRVKDGTYMVWKRGLYTQQIFDVFGAAVAAGWLLGLDAEQMANALGIAGEQAAGTMQSHGEGVWTRRLHGGLAAANGVRAALLAKTGFTGPTHIFEGRYGLYTAFDLEFHPEKLVDGLGEEWEFLDVWYKAYPCYTIAHAMIESVLSLMREHDVGPEQVEKIVGHQPRWTQWHLRSDFPTLVTVQYGPRFILASTLLRGKFGLDEVSDETLNDERIHAFARDNVEIVLSDRLAAVRDESRPRLRPEHEGRTIGRTSPGGAELVLKDGRTVATETLYPLGCAANPMSREQMREKFELLARASEVLEEEEIGELYRRIQHLSDDVPVAEVSALLSRQRSEAGALARG